MKIFYGRFQGKTKRGEPKIVIRAVSPNRPHLEQTIKRGIEWHCEHTGADAAPLLKQFHKGAWDMRIMNTGVPYCGSWPIGQPGVSQTKCMHTKGEQQ